MSEQITEQVTETVAGTETEQETKPNSEAAKYRTRLRETETERDALTQRLEAAQRALVEGRVAGHMKDVADFWTHVELASVLDADGSVDAIAVSDAVNTLLADKPHYAAGRCGPYVPQDGKVVTSPPAASWQSALSGNM